VCVLFVGQSAWRALQALRSASRPALTPAIRREIGYALVAAVGPLLWMAWNAHAHGDPLHFIARVTSFRRAIGAANVPLRDKLLGFPRALVEETPEVAAMGLAGLAGLVASRAIRERWGWAAAAAASVAAFLVLGDLGDGAPTHHPARALASIWWIAIGTGTEALVTASERMQRMPGHAWRWVAAGAGLLLAMLWFLPIEGRWRDWPGRAPSEARDAQIARGLDLRARGVTGAEITPCSFEHFALLAAWGQPERAHVAPRTGEVPTGDCPRVLER
jgi:hypothetical protein